MTMTLQSTPPKEDSKSFLKTLKNTTAIALLSVSTLAISTSCVQASLKAEADERTGLLAGQEHGADALRRIASAKNTGDGVESAPAPLPFAILAPTTGDKGAARITSKDQIQGVVPRKTAVGEIVAVRTFAATDQDLYCGLLTASFLLEVYLKQRNDAIKSLTKTHRTLQRRNEELEDQATKSLAKISELREELKRASTSQLLPEQEDVEVGTINGDPAQRSHATRFYTLLRYGLTAFVSAGVSAGITYFLVRSK